MQVEQQKAQVNLDGGFIEESRNRLSSILASLTRQSTSELCSLPSPPSLIKDLGSVILILIGSEDYSWKAFTKELKNYSRFISKLSAIQVDLVDQSTIHKMEEISSIVDINNRVMESNSSAAKDLSNWVLTFVSCWRDFQNSQQFVQNSREYEEAH